MKTIAVILAIIAFSKAQNTSFYTNLVYIAKHQIGYDEAYESGQDVLLDYLQKAFEVDDRTHEQALRDATNMKPLKTHFKVEVIEAKDLVWKDPSGKSDPFCTLYMKSSPKERYNTEVKNKTLTPVWNDEFYLTTEDAENDVLCLEVWHYNPAKTIMEKMFKVGDVHGVRGFLKLAEEMAMTYTSGNTSKTFIGSIRIPIKNIPVTGSTTWYVLKKPGKSEDRGSIRLKLAFSAANNTQVAVQEHRHLLNTLLSYEFNTAPTNALSPAAGTLIHQHAARKGLLPRNVALSEWIEYSNKSTENPQYFVVFNKLANALHQPITDGLFSSDDVTLFWEAATKVLYSCFDSIKMIERLPTYINNPTEQLTDILRIISSITSLKVPEDFNLFPAEMYHWLPKQNDTKIDVLKMLKYTVRENHAIWWDNLFRQNSLEINTDQEAIEHCIDIVQQAIDAFVRVSDAYDSIFIKIVNFPYARTIHMLYGERLSDLCATTVQNVSQQFGRCNVDNDSKLVWTSTEFKLSETLFELYKALQKFVRHGRCLGMDDSDTFKIHNYYNWFRGVVVHWLDTWMQNANRTIESRTNIDNLDMSFNPNGSSISTSGDAVEVVYKEMRASWYSLAWPNIEESLIYLELIINHTCQCAIYYADMILTKVENVTPMSDQENLTNVRKSTVYDLRAPCFAISNINYAANDLLIWSSDLYLRQLVDRLRTNETRQRVDSFKQMFKRTANSIVDSLHTKIAELIENIGNKMVPAMSGYSTDGADEPFDTNTWIAQLTDNLNYNAGILVKNLDADDIQRISVVIWEKLLQTLFHLIHSHFYDGTNDDMLEKILNLQKFYDISTAQLVRLYYICRILEQHDLNRPTAGELLISPRFANNSLIVQVRRAGDLPSGGYDETYKRFVKLRIVPKENFNNIGSRSTGVLNLRLSSTSFNETFEMRLTTEQRNLQDAILVFEMMKVNDRWPNTFMSEAFLPFSEIPVGGHKRDLIFLDLSQPGKTSSGIITALENRKNDKEAKEFLEWLSEREMY